MEIKISVGDENKITFLSKLTAVFFGIFLTAVIFAIAMKILDTNGLWIALLLCTVLITASFYYLKKGTLLRIITWSMLTTIILGTILFILFQYWASNTLNQIV